MRLVIKGSPKNAKREATRKAVEVARVSRCVDNVERLAEIVRAARV